VVLPRLVFNRDVIFYLSFTLLRNEYSLSKDVTLQMVINFIVTGANQRRRYNIAHRGPHYCYFFCQESTVYTPPKNNCNLNELYIMFHIMSKFLIICW
jgi:hypothetical protein